MTKLQRTVLLVLALIMVGLLAAAGIAYFNRQEPEPIINAFVPPEFDPAALPGTPGDLAADLAYGKLELKPDAIVSMCANVKIENDAARVFLTSHEGNYGWLKIKLLDEEGELLGQSGLIRPGEYLESVPLTRLPEESGLITAKLLIYEPDTYLSLGSAGVQVMLIK